MNIPIYYEPVPRSENPSRIVCDICIYGGTSGAVVAAVQAKRLGQSVVVLAFGDRLGGLTTSGLGATDFGNKAAIGGIALEFYREVGRHYDQDVSWTFEPKVASKVFEDLVKRWEIPVFYRQHLIRVQKNGAEIREVEMEDGNTIQAKIFIDASYEGDLMAMAGVSHHVGRESNATYDEIFNGIQFGQKFHNFFQFVDPFRKEGDPASGLLPGISDESHGQQGEGDHRVQAYNFRMCLTQRDDNRLPFPKPTDYDPERFTLLARYLATGVWDVLKLTTWMPNGKTDTNNFGGFSTDNIGMNHGWPTGSYAAREAIFQDHVQYGQGLFWFLCHDERVPENVRQEILTWGLPRDEFVKTGGWPPELYIREARRMVSDYVMTEHNCVGRLTASDSVALAAYGMDSHHCRRVVRAGRAFNEGDVQIAGFRPYPIAYASLVPKEAECTNLIVPFCLSASHIAFGSIRMEPVFMVLGQSAATAAHQAISEKAPVQKISYRALRRQLENDGQVLEWKC